MCNIRNRSVPLASFNVNGLRDIDKFEKVLKLCDTDILCLQETHWDTVLENRGKKVWSGHFFSSHGTQRARGVSILVNKNSKIDAALIDRDREGRWVKIRFVFEGFEHRLLNIYAPNKEGDRVSFFQELNGVAKDCTIVMGDFNVKLCRLDVSDDCSFKCDASRSTLTNFLLKTEFCDLWRNAHPMAREYSRIQSCAGEVKRSRIDYCLVKKSQTHFGSRHHKRT
uniref:exodeoxyribonuclease III n=1 Tax=Seriola lalandi dorsalis TaxID=1841481 RepID=A0A3B4XWX2_SERLL